MNKKVLVAVATGVEEIETMCLVDILRRAGAEVTMAAVDSLQVKAAHGVTFIADCLIEACQDKIYDLIVLPGGLPGAEYLRDSSILRDLLKAQKKAQRWFGAICAAPAVVLAYHGLVDDCLATAYPTFLKQLPKYDRENLDVVVDNYCVTSKSPSTAMAFALKLVTLLYGKELTL